MHDPSSDFTIEHIWASTKQIQNLVLLTGKDFSIHVHEAGEILIHISLIYRKTKFDSLKTEVIRILEL